MGHVVFTNADKLGAISSSGRTQGHSVMVTFFSGRTQGHSVSWSPSSLPTSLVLLKPGYYSCISTDNPGWTSQGPCFQRLPFGKRYDPWSEIVKLRPRERALSKVPKDKELHLHQHLLRSWQGHPQQEEWSSGRRLHGCCSLAALVLPFCSCFVPSPAAQPWQLPYPQDPAPTLLFPVGTPPFCPSSSSASPGSENSLLSSRLLISHPGGLLCRSCGSTKYF